MTWLYVPSPTLNCLPGEAGSPSGLGLQSQTYEPFVTLSGTPTRRPASWRGWRTRPWIWRLSGIALKHSTAARGVDLWISSLAASRAKTFPSQASGRALPGNAPDSGHITLALSGKSSLRLSSSKTSPRLKREDSMSSSPTWSVSVTPGRTPRFARATLERRTDGNGCLFWPTPSATPYGNNQGGAAGRVGKVRPSLDSLASMWPTPRASDGDKGGPNQTQKGKQALASVAYWATPTSRDWKDGLNPSMMVPTNSLLGRQAVRVTLPGQAKTGRMSPRALNPRFVEWLMGWPLGWTDCERSATESFRMWLRSRGRF
jgi:hypothetical protein